MGILSNAFPADRLSSYPKQSFHKPRQHAHLYHSSYALVYRSKQVAARRVLPSPHQNLHKSVEAVLKNFSLSCSFLGLEVTSPTATSAGLSRFLLLGESRQP